jgi:hypothetical protein
VITHTLIRDTSLMDKRSFPTATAQ